MRVFRNLFVMALTIFLIGMFLKQGDVFGALSSSCLLIMIFDAEGDRVKFGQDKDFRKIRIFLIMEIGLFIALFMFIGILAITGSAYNYYLAPCISILVVILEIVVSVKTLKFRKE